MQMVRVWRWGSELGIAELDQQSDHGQQMPQYEDPEGTQHVLYGKASTPALQLGSPVV